MENVFPERLKQARNKLRMTQANLAEKSGLSYASISAYEKGAKTPNIIIAAALAKVLCVSTDWLVGLDDNQTPQPSTLGDCAQIMLGAVWAWERQGLIDRIEISGNERECLTIKISKGILLNFIRDWAKVHEEMYCRKVIDQEMYEAWMEKRIRELAKISLLDNK